MAGSSRIFSQFFKKNWREYFSKRGLHRPSGGKQNSTYQYFNYLQTDAGRKAFEIIVPGISLATSLYLVGDWIGIVPYVNNFETLDDEKDRTNVIKISLLDEKTLHFSEKMATLTQEVAKDLSLAKSTSEDIRIFKSNSHFPLALGILNNHMAKPLIGYPSFMDWNSREDVRLEGAVFKLYFNPVSAKGFEFIHGDGILTSDQEKDNFVFSDRARKFMLGKSVLETDSDRIIHRFLLPIVGINVAHIFTRAIKGRLPDLFASIPLKIGLYIFMGSLMSSVMLLVYAMDTLEREYANIKTLCSLSEDYRLGGLEYYSKVKNIGAFLYKNIKYNDFYFTEDGEVVKSEYAFHNEKWSSLQGRINYCDKFSEHKDKSLPELLLS